VVLGPGGLRAGAREGLVIVDLTTGLPSKTLAIAEALNGTGIRLLDAPMTLTPKEAEEGRLNLLVGGDKALFEELTPLFETFTERLFYTGPLGSAHTLKLINNFLGHGNNALVTEAVATALKAGVDPHMMRELISVSGGNSTSFQRMMRVVCGDQAGGGGAFSIRNALKDVRYFNHVADEQDVYAPLGDAVRRFYHRAVALGYGDQMLPELFEVQGRLSGIKLKP
jgi:3-hydroxyisobutyrate dehydrogenase-like beta-hydroxyacid dehydrogenase